LVSFCLSLASIHTKNLNPIHTYINTDTEFSLEAMRRGSIIKSNQMGMNIRDKKEELFHILLVCL
jgi:hypothetical protein